MKAILSTGRQDGIMFPNHKIGICVEQWGNALSSAGYDVDFISGTNLISSINNCSNQYNVICTELLPNQWSALCRLDKPCNATIVGIAHAPPHNLEVETYIRKDMMIQAWNKCDYLIAMDIGLEYYAEYFAPESTLVCLPHPVPGYNGKIIYNKDEKIMLFHIMEPGHHDFDNYLTMRVIQSCGYIPVIIVREKDLCEMSYWTDRYSIDAEIHTVLPYKQFSELVSECYAVCQISGRPSLGRIVADAARVGTVAIASDYWYMRFLFPDNIIRTPQELEYKISNLNDYSYKAITSKAKASLSDISINSIGNKLLEMLL